MHATSTGAFQQATRWPGAMSRSGGGSCRQRRSANGQRGAKRQPLRLVVGAGHRAFDGGEPLAVDVEARDRAQQADRVGVLGIGKQVGHIGALDDLAGVHHQHLVGDLGDHAEIVGDDQDRHAEPALQVAQEVENLGLDGDVERGRRLVGDQQRRLARQRHGDHDALAHAARQVVRIVVDALRRRGDPHQFEHFDRTRPAPPAATSWCGR